MSLRHWYSPQALADELLVVRIAEELTRPRPASPSATRSTSSCGSNSPSMGPSASSGPAFAGISGPGRRREALDAGPHRYRFPPHLTEGGLTPPLPLLHFPFGSDQSPYLGGGWRQPWSAPPRLAAPPPRRRPRCPGLADPQVEVVTARTEPCTLRLVHDRPVYIWRAAPDDRADVDARHSTSRRSRPRPAPAQPQLGGTKHAGRLEALLRSRLTRRSWKRSPGRRQVGIEAALQLAGRLSRTVSAYRQPGWACRVPE